MRAPRQRDPLQAPRFSFRLVISGRSSNGASNVEVVFPTLNTHPIARFRWRRLRSELAALLRLWAERSCQRRHLAEIAKWDDFVLKDIGVSRQQALGRRVSHFGDRNDL